MHYFMHYFVRAAVYAITGSVSPRGFAPSVFAVSFFLVGHHTQFKSHLNLTNATSFSPAATTTTEWTKP